MSFFKGEVGESFLREIEASCGLQFLRNNISSNGLFGRHVDYLR